MIEKHDRIVWIDYAKAAAIYFVVLLHTHCDADISRTINGFIMPLFFFISGYLFSYRNNPSYSRFTYKRFRQLLVPYLWINVIAYVAWLLVLRRFGSDDADLLEWHTPLLGILTGVGPLLVHDIPVWSLLSFFVVEIVYYPVGRFVKPYIVMPAAFALSWCLYVFDPTFQQALPLVAGPSLAGIGFYAAGDWFRNSAPDTKYHGLKAVTLQCIGVILSAAGLLFALSANSEVVFYTCHFGSYPLFLLSSFSGTVLICCLAALSARLFGTSRLLSFISTGTLLICGFHLLAFAAIKGLLLFGFGVQPDTLTAGPLNGISLSIAAVALLLPFIHLVRKDARFLVDK